MNRYNPANWLKHNRVSVYYSPKGDLKDTGREYTSPLLLVRWVRTGRPGDVVLGVLEAEIISPLGRPTRPVQQFSISTDPQSYQLWRVNSDRLPFRLHARHLDNPKITTQIEIWEFIPLQNLSTMGNPFGPLDISIDTTPITDAINQSAAEAAANASALGSKLDQLVGVAQPGQTPKFTEFLSEPWNGSAIQVLGRDTNRRSITLTVPARSNSGQPNTKVVYVAVGDAPQQINDYQYRIPPGGGLTLETHEAVQDLWAWQDPNTTAQECNVSHIYL